MLVVVAADEVAVLDLENRNRKPNGGETFSSKTEFRLRNQFWNRIKSTNKACLAANEAMPSHHYL